MDYDCSMSLNAISWNATNQVVIFRTTRGKSRVCYLQGFRKIQSKNKRNTSFRIVSMEYFKEQQEF